MIIKDFNKKIGLGFKKLFTSIQKYSFFCTIIMTNNKLVLLIIGETLTWKMHNLEESEIQIKLCPKDGNTLFESKCLLILRGVPIIYYNSIISVIFNKNFSILESKKNY
jgi:hypothetical protein